MARFRLFLTLAFCGAFTALAASLLLGAIFGLLTDGPPGMIGGLLLGLMGFDYSVVLTLPAALLLGSLLWLCRVRLRAIWASTGAVAGLAAYAVVSIFPANFRQAMADLVGQNHMVFGLACAAAGALAALVFRLLIETLTALDEPSTAD